MNAGSDPGRRRERALTELTRAEGDALRESIRHSLRGEPERDERGVELYVLEVQAAIGIYRAPPTPEPGPPEAAREDEAPAPELEALARSAQSLLAGLEGLGGASRGRLLEGTGLDAGSLDDLVRLARRIESELREARQPSPRRKGATGSRREQPEVELVEELSIIWARHVVERIPRDREGESPWAGFVEVACGIAGLDAGVAHRARLRVYDSASLAESAELLATVPDL
jgi:hypothetical protein